MVAPLDHDSPDPHCQSCRDDGIPAPKFLNLNRRHLRVAQCLLSANTASEGVKTAALATGYSENYVRDLRAGRRAPEFRRFYQMYLEQAGGDIARVAQVQVDCLAADEQKWNPKEEVFDAFPDHRTRLRASQHIGKMLEMEPPKQDGINVGVAIKIQTNLGSGETYDPPNIIRPDPVVVDVSREG